MRSQLLPVPGQENRSRIALGKRPAGAQRAAHENGPLPYRAAWERDVRAGIDGQVRSDPATWKLDRLYHAVLWQLKTEEAEQSLNVAMCQGAHADTIAALLREYEYTRETAHRVYLGEVDACGQETKEGREARKRRMRQGHNAA